MSGDECCWALVKIHDKERIWCKNPDIFEKLILEQKINHATYTSVRKNKHILAREKNNGYKSICYDRQIPVARQFHIIFVIESLSH